MLYGIESPDSDTNFDSGLPMKGVISIVVKRLRTVADDSYSSTRGWDDFYLLLIQILEMGHIEMAEMLNHGLLDFCLRLFTMHVPKLVRQEHRDFAKIMEKKRGVTNNLVGFVTNILLRTDLRLPSLLNSQSDDRLATLDRETMKFPLTRQEKHLLFYWTDDLKAIAFLDKAVEVFDQTKGNYLFPGAIVRWMLQVEDTEAQTNLTKTISEGITLDPPYCDSYVSVALAFCQACPVAANVSSIILSVCKNIGSASRVQEERALDGEVVLEFYTGLLRAENRTLFEAGDSHIFYHWLMTKSRLFVFCLLLDKSDVVRRGAHALIRELYGSEVAMTPELMPVKMKSVRELAKGMIHKIVYEKDAGILRSHLNPLISTCQYFVQILWQLLKDDSPEAQMYKDVNDGALISQYQTEIEPRLRIWPQDEGTPVSQGDTFDQSDYGSESDDANELLDI